jgi:hypothetical protein
MATPPSGPDQAKRLTDLLVLVLGNTDLGKARKPGEIRQLVNIQELYDGKTLDLAPLWPALLAEAGMSEFKLAPLFLQLKEWEGRLDTTVALPAQLASLDRNLAKKHLVRFPAIKQSDLDPLLYPSLASAVAAAVAPAPAPAKPAPRPAEAAPPAPKAEAPTAPLTGRRKAVLAGAAVVLVVALVLAGLSLFSRPGSAYPTARLDSILRVEHGRRVGHAVTLVVTDPRWEAMPKPDRQQTLDRLFKALEPEGVKSLLLRDVANRSLGVASSVGNDRVVRVE